MNLLSNSSRSINRSFTRLSTFSFMMLAFVIQSTAQDVGAASAALASANAEIVKFVAPVQTIMYSIAGIVAFIGIIKCTQKVIAGDGDAGKTIMAFVGGCLFFVIGAALVPTMFGI
ncbi:MAG: DUF4134 family protein [Cyclobacteriaceae bacterium]